MAFKKTVKATAAKAAPPKKVSATNSRMVENPDYRPQGACDRKTPASKVK